MKLVISKYQHGRFSFKFKRFLIESQNYKKEPHIYYMIKGLYYEKRPTLHAWVKQQCRRFKLNTQTFANSLHLMDKYYKYNQLDKQKFVQYALCIIAISTKAFETKVLFIRSIAKNNKFDFQQTQQAQRHLLFYFNFKVSSYNFIRVAHQYMKRWDNSINTHQQGREGTFFIKESLQNYINYMQILHFCQKWFTMYKSLLQKDLKTIFIFVTQNSPYTKEKIDFIFKNPLIETSLQQQYSYQMQRIPQGQRQKSLVEWKAQFEELIPKVKKRYEERRKYRTYGQFLSLLF